ncbi:hypothetical protein J6590_061404 [Homalodisca vitripennis]|nr:hypothetical protein J6590_061404 [Homalodisca vitripennis]
MYLLPKVARLRRALCPGVVPRRFRFTDTAGHVECRERPKNPFYDPYYENSVWGPRPRCLIGRKSQVTVASGVGVGPELMRHVKRILLAANAPVDFENMSCNSNNGYEDMDNIIYSVERNGVAIKGNLEKRLEPLEISRNMQLRRSLDLFVQLIEIKSYPALVEKMRCKHNVDVVIVRQNVEGEFALLEHHNGKGIENLKITTEYNTRRLAEFAFQYAIKHKRRKVTVVYNKGFMNSSEGLFVNTISDVAEKYPDVTFTKQSMRGFAFRMTDFNFNGDVLITGVLYGGLIMYLMFGLMHGAGMFCGQNLGPRYAVFEPAVRHKGFKQMGKDIANPVSTLDCAVKMLHYLGHHEAARRIERAIDLTINEDLVHTRDMLGVASTSTMVHNIERRIRESMPVGYSDDETHPPPLPPTPPSVPPYKP